MRQIPLGLGLEEAHTFENFFAGSQDANAAALAHLQALNGQAQPAPVYLWGETGAGKTHLLQALAHEVASLGGRVGWFDAGSSLAMDFDDTWRLLVLDQCELYGPAQQQRAFSLFVQATGQGRLIASAGRLPPVDLPLRDDLRTRLGWGHVFQLQPLSENDCRAVLRRAADRRGIFLSDEVMSYLLTRFSRDLGSLMALLLRLDSFALAAQRAVTVPLLKQMLAEEGA
ncbi:DnaA regulatory inactivator Hda [Aquabacterium sp. A7-Y]|uniref:DnaA regulatory inactivator Hda n=1 Tax=Aquabacterium sp. A7-Y TaxID=1349605 RepID=UPI00223DB76B|nr:DnaA regulatory inactivator Hda [Aquabacterium sp. A7-Y]MCW7536461.1 DnaA regulatory inactivator Hda [Aquabacterium sp. A7-Y]